LKKVFNFFSFLLNCWKKYIPFFFITFSPLKSGLGSAFVSKPWILIRIRKKWMRIQNPDLIQYGSGFRIRILCNVFQYTNDRTIFPKCCYIFVCHEVTLRPKLGPPPNFLPLLYWVYSLSSELFSVQEWSRDVQPLSAKGAKLSHVPGDWHRHQEPLRRKGSQPLSIINLLKQLQVPLIMFPGCYLHVHTLWIQVLRLSYRDPLQGQGNGELKCGSFS